MLDSRPFNAWIRAAWVHEFLTDRSVTAGFTVLPGSTFTVDGAHAASNAARFDLGVKYDVGSQTSLFVNGSTELSDRGAEPRRHRGPAHRLVELARTSSIAIGRAI